MGERANSKADQVYGELKEAILTGTLEPGAPIDKLALCDRLGVSRFPVSAAISRLAFERLVRDGAAARLVRRAHLGRRRARAAVHSPRARRRNRRRSGAPLDALGREALAENLARERRSGGGGRPEPVLRARRRFHQALTTHLGLRRSAEILDGLRAHLERVAPSADDCRRAASRRLSPSTRRSSRRSKRATPSAPARRWSVIWPSTTEAFESFARERPELFSA